MTFYADGETKYTREDLLGVLAAELGSSPDDPRIIDAYEDVVTGWAHHAVDREAAYDAYFGPGPIATDSHVGLLRAWASGRILID